METKGISKLDLKRRNRRQILLAIRNAGMLARVDIAHQLSLTRAAVTIITNQMISQGILEDLNTPVIPQENSPKRKGRRKTMIRINPNYRFALGAVVSDDIVSVGLSALDNTVLGKSVMTLKPETDIKEISSYIVRTCRSLMKKASLKPENVLGLGVGVMPSQWENVGAVTEGDNIVCFDSMEKLLAEKLGMSVFCGNALGLAALANVDYQDPATLNHLMIYLGESFHSVVVKEGELIYGIRTGCTAIDRMIVNPNGLKHEGYPDGSMRAESAASEVLDRLYAETGRRMDLAELNAAYDAGDPDAVRVSNASMDKVSFLLYNLYIVYHTKYIVLQARVLSDRAIAYLQSRLDALDPDAGITLVRSRVSGSLGFLAGCKLVIENRFFQTGGMLPEVSVD